MSTTTYNWVSGEAVESNADEVPIFNPATGRTIGTVQYADSAVIDQAVSAALTAFHSWKDTPTSQRAKLFYALRTNILANVKSLTDLITAEEGKTIAEARAEVMRAVDAIETAARVPASLKGAYAQPVTVEVDVDAFSVPYPLGVCLGISPYKFPVLTPLVMSAIAIAAGNSFVLKPSEQDPSASIRIAELYRQANLPPGVFTVLHGDSKVAEALIDHDDICAVSFMGSTHGARLVHLRSVLAGKRTQALGAARNHLVVAEDADLDAAADALSSAVFGTAGQRCMVMTTAVAIGGIADRLVDHLSRRVQAIIVGAGTDANVDMGPLISEIAKERVLGYLERAEDEGAKVVADRREVIVKNYERGYFVGPVLLDSVDPTMETYHDEVIGPVLNTVRVGSLDHAIELIHQSPCGNGASIYTRQGAVASKFHREAPAGAIGINMPIPLPLTSVGFGGWKQSIVEQSGIRGTAWDFYTRPKFVTARWDDPEGIDLTFRP